MKNTFLRMSLDFLLLLPSFVVIDTLVLLHYQCEKLISVSSVIVFDFYLSDKRSGHCSISPGRRL